MRTVSSFAKDNNSIAAAFSRIHDVIKNMEDEWLYEAEIMSRSKCASRHISAYREVRPDLLVKVRHGKTVWAKTPSIAKELRKLA